MGILLNSKVRSVMSLPLRIFNIMRVQHIVVLELDKDLNDGTKVYNDGEK
jgi:hypothetical protein